MIILDTNVISELMRAKPDAIVMAWLNSCDVADIFTTAITKSELLYGLSCMPAGKRRSNLERQYSDLFNTLLVGKFLPFEEACAPHFAEVAYLAFSQGNNCATTDLQIAAIARFHGHRIATRNVKDFSHGGVAIINPWES